MIACFFIRVRRAIYVYEECDRNPCLQMGNK